MSDSPSSPPPAAGTFVWNELNTNNRADAGKFYTELFGWGLDRYEHGSLVSEMFKIGPNHIGGLVDNPDPTGAPFWLCYVRVDDIAATCAKVVALGGKIVLPITPVPNVGTIAVLQDRQGAYLGMFQA